MPLPFILAGMAIAAGGWGVKKGVDAKEDMDSAERWNRKAKRVFNDAKSSLEENREMTQKAMENLGQTKIDIWEYSMTPFIESFRQIKNMDISKGDYASDSLPAVDSNDLKNMTATAIAMSEVASGGVTALGSGGLAGLAAYGGVQVLATASTGTALSALSGAAATNATLAWFGGGSLATGGLGMAGGTMVLGGIVAGPVLAIGGMMMASKAEEAKHNAWANYDEAELAAEQMKTAEVAAKGIGKRFNEVDQVLERLNNRFAEGLTGFAELVNSNDNYATYSEDEKSSVYMISALAKTMKNILDAQLLDEDGTLTANSRKVVNEGQEVLAKI